MAAASTSRVVDRLAVSREEKAALEALRCSPDLFAFSGFSYAFGRTLGFTSFSVTDLGARVLRSAAAGRSLLPP